MAPRSSWKGYLKVSLVSVPVKAYTAKDSDGSRIRLNQLHRDCHSRIQHHKVCPQHGTVSQEEIVSGYEYAPGQYVVLEPDELDGLRSEGDKSVKLESFVETGMIDPVYHTGKTFYLLPDGPVGQRAYQLLHHSMTEDGLHGLARMVVNGKEQMVLLRPCRQLLALTVLEYQERLKQPEGFEDELSEVTVSQQERELTTKLVQSLKKDDLDLADYQDTYTQRLAELIDAKIEGRELVTAPQPEQDDDSAELMNALQQSLQQAGQGEDSLQEQSASGKMAPSTRQRSIPEDERRKKSG